MLFYLLIVSLSGYLTLTGRSGPDNLFKSEIIPLCGSRMALRHACVAYQASLEDNCQSLTASYLQLALSEYSLELQQPERLREDATLATGILLCSVSVRNVTNFVISGADTCLDQQFIHLDATFARIILCSTISKFAGAYSAEPIDPASSRSRRLARPATFYTKPHEQATPHLGPVRGAVQRYGY